MLLLGQDVHGWEDGTVAGGTGAISRWFSLPGISGFSKAFLCSSLQVLGPQRREHEVDLSGPHLGRHRGKNPMAEPPNPFWGKGIERDPERSLVVTGAVSQPPQHLGGPV